MNIFEISAEYMRLQTALENGEDVAEALVEIKDKLEVKADNYARVIRNLEAENKARRDEIQRQRDRITTNENSIEWLKGNLETAMRLEDKLKFKTDLFSFGIAKNGGKAPLVLDVEPSELPEDLLKPREPDKEAIRKYIEETGDVSYGHFEERGESLRIR